MPNVSLLIKPSSSMCNLRCRYCFYEDEAKNRSLPSFGFMKEDTLEIIIKKTLEYASGTCTIAWQGGEPTLIGLPFFKKAMELIQKYNIRKLPVQNVIQTNGTLLNEEWAAFLAQHHFLTGLSLDGTKDTHNAFRVLPDGGETFFQVLNAGNLLDRFQADYNILAVVNGRSVKKAGKIYDFYKKHHMEHLQFIPCLDPLPAEGAAEKKWDFSLDPKEYGDFLNELFDRWYEDWTKGSAPYIRSFENYIGILAGYPPESCDQRGICSIQYVIEADGSVYPCDFYVLDDYRLGSLITDSFQELEDKRRQLRFLEFSKEQLSSCRSCPYFYICRGGCRRHREPVSGPSGDSLHYRNRFCESYQMFFSHSLERMQKIAAGIPPLR